VKLNHLDAWNQRRKVVAARYLEALSKVPDLILPYAPEWADPCWHQFVVRHPHRDALKEHLSEAGIGTLIHYPVPPHLQEAYTELDLSRGFFPITEDMHLEILSLPINPHLSIDEVGVIINAIYEFGSV
jgi:dTDP-4-amino-4,6-dideoxygalactose transaminase